MSKEGNAELQLVIFGLAGESYGVDINTVREIIRMQEITVVPQAPGHIEGVINLRGRVIPVASLRKRFGLPTTEETKDSRIVVVEAHDESVGIVVDAVEEVSRIPTDAIEPPAALITSAASDYLEGIAKVEESLIVLLNVNRVLSFEEAHAADAVEATEEATTQEVAPEEALALAA